MSGDSIIVTDVKTKHTTIEFTDSKTGERKVKPPSMCVRVYTMPQKGRMRKLEDPESAQPAAHPAAAAAILARLAAVAHSRGVRDVRRSDWFHCGDLGHTLSPDRRLAPPLPGRASEARVPFRRPWGP